MHWQARPVQALLILLILLLASPAARAQLVLNEALADPASDWSGDGEVNYKDDEWIEVVNRGDSPLQLDDYWISDSVAEPACRYRFSGELAPQTALLVTGAMAVAWQEAMGLGSAGLSLSNTGGEVALFRDGDQDTLLVDSVAYLRYQMEDDRALGRYPLESEQWLLFDGLNLYHGNQEPGSTGCLPSPGAPNVCEGTAVRRADWGGVKRIYAIDSP
jgi:hypothetical protein